jgi:hypothetical protein
MTEHRAAMNGYGGEESAPKTVKRVKEEKKKKI